MKAPSLHDEYRMQYQSDVGEPMGQQQYVCDNPTALENSYNFKILSTALSHKTIPSWTVWRIRNAPKPDIMRDTLYP